MLLIVDHGLLVDAQGIDHGQILGNGGVVLTAFGEDALRLGTFVLQQTHQNNCLHLDGQYSIFGEVTEGLEIIDKIAVVETDYYDRPLQDVIIESIRPVAEDTVQVDTTAVKDPAAKDSIEAKPAILPETMLINE